MPVADDVQRFCIKHPVSKTLPQKTQWITCAFRRGYFVYLLPQKVMAERGARLLVFFASLIVLRLGGADKGKFPSLSFVINVACGGCVKERSAASPNPMITLSIDESVFYQLIVPTLIFTLMFTILPCTAWLLGLYFVL